MAFVKHQLVVIGVGPLYTNKCIRINLDKNPEINKKLL